MSTRHFFKTMGPYLHLHTITDHDLDSIILKVYKDLMCKYHKEKTQIPQNNLIEIAFSDLESQPEKILEKIYTQLRLPDYKIAKIKFDKYLEGSKSYKKNKHLIKKEVLDKILNEWGFAMKEWNYEVPENIEIV